MIDDDWAPLARGQVIADLRVIRTGANGWATFRSGNQTVEMQPSSQIQISSHPDRDHTWILHAGGEITADVEAREVEHFGVRTHEMVAVVKGTRFTVIAGQGSDTVVVERGTVAVSESERGLSVAINAGQRASGGSGRLVVDGQGQLPIVVDASGRAVVMPPAPTSNPSQFSGTPENAGNSSAQSGTIPGNASGQAENRPGNSASAPGQTDGGPGNSTNAPGRSGDAPGNSGNAPGRSGDGPGNSASAPGQSGDGPGNSANAPGRSGDGPGNSANAPGRTGDGPGNSANAPGRSGGNGNGPNG